MSRTLLVDSLNLSFRFAGKMVFKGLKGAKGAAPFSLDYLSTLRAFARSFKCEDIVICSDLRGSKYRKSIYPEYKANRIKKDKTEEEQEEFFKFMSYWKDAEINAELQGIPLLKFEGIEADDVFANIVINHPNDEYVLLSTDSDLDQLISEKVWRFAYTTKKEFRLSNWDEMHPYVSRENFVAAKCIKGDTSDNIPGAKGVGDKRIQAFINMYGDPMLWDAEMFPGVANYKTALREFLGTGMLERNYSLIDLTHCNKDIITREIQEVINAKH